MNHPLVSILMANYNNDKFIDEAIESVSAQTWVDWELIIVDDNSTDSSWTLISKWGKRDNRIKAFRNGSHLNCGGTKRETINHAHGIYLAFVDPDDIIVPSAVETLVVEIEKDENIALVNSDHFICDSHLHPKRRSYGACHIPKHESYLSYGRGITALAMFRKAHYVQTPGINQNFPRAVDQDLYYKLEEVGCIKYVDEPLYYYRVHKGGISSYKNMTKARYWHAQAVEDAFRRRQTNSQIKNISWRQVRTWWSIYLASEAADKLREGRVINFFRWARKSMAESLFDRKIFLKLRVIVSRISMR